MKLLDEIIEGASSDKPSLSTLLRKALVLAHKLKNNNLKQWVSGELNGYDKNDALPSYRVVRAIAKGQFAGSFGRQITGQPIPPAALKERHREFAERVYLRQPISAYFTSSDENGNPNDAMMEWHPNLVLMYQSSFFEGDYALLRAWQEIPSSVIVGLNDIVVGKLLQLALDLHDELGISGTDDVSELPPTRVEPIVTNNIYGGTNLISGQANNVTQNNYPSVTRNDFSGLIHLLQKLGVQSAAIDDLSVCIEDDKIDGSPVLGGKVKGWLAGVGRYLGPSVLEIATKAIEDYCGLK